MRNHVRREGPVQETRTDLAQDSTSLVEYDTGEQTILKFQNFFSFTWRVRMLKTRDARLHHVPTAGLECWAMTRCRCLWIILWYLSYI